MCGGIGNTGVLQDMAVLVETAVFTGDINIIVILGQWRIFFGILPKKAGGPEQSNILVSCGLAMFCKEVNPIAPTLIIQ